MSKPLWLREIDRNSANNWQLVLGLLTNHTAPGAPLTSRNIKKLIRRRHNPALIRNGGKP